MRQVAHCTLRGPCWCAVLFAALAAGCGQSGPELAPVAGRVMLDGKPLKYADVVFQPDEMRPPANGRTDEEGRYLLLYKRGHIGARVGEHTVRILFNTNLVNNPPNIPARYNRESELRVEVVAGKENEFNFDLKTDPKSK